MEILPNSALNSVNSAIIAIIFIKSSFGTDTVSVFETLDGLGLESGKDTNGVAGVTELKLNIVIVK